MSNAVQRLIDEAVAAERERCAKIIEDMDSYSVSGRGVYKRHPRTRAMLQKIAAQKNIYE